MHTPCHDPYIIGPLPCSWPHYILLSLWIPTLSHGSFLILLERCKDWLFIWLLSGYCAMCRLLRETHLETTLFQRQLQPLLLLFFSKHHYIRSNLIHVYVCSLNDCFQTLHTSPTLNQCVWENFLWWWKCSIPVLPDTTATSLLSTWNVTTVTEEVNF